MSVTQRFRSALNGFNREDVVNYIEYINNRHTTEVEQLKNQLQEAKGSVSGDVVLDLQSQLDAALKRCKELEARLSVKEAASNRELEAYRRAEETERMAKMRAQEIYNKANSALTTATATAETAAEAFNSVAERTAQQLQEYQDSISATVDSFKSVIASLNSAKP